jgi:hypothetical protein
VIDSIVAGMGLIWACSAGSVKVKSVKYPAGQIIATDYFAPSGMDPSLLGIRGKLELHIAD